MSNCVLLDKATQKYSTTLEWRIYNKKKINVNLPYKITYKKEIQYQGLKKKSD